LDARGLNKILLIFKEKQIQMYLACHPQLPSLSIPHHLQIIQGEYIAMQEETYCSSLSLDCLYPEGFSYKIYPSDWHRIFGIPQFAILDHYLFGFLQLSLQVKNHWI